MQAAVVAGVRRARLDPVELACLAALGAVGVRAVVREALTPQPIETRLVVRELLKELHDRVRGLRSGASTGIVAINLRHAQIVSLLRTYVKGILA
jgi:hypothetical protein